MKKTHKEGNSVSWRSLGIYSARSTMPHLSHCENKIIEHVTRVCTMCGLIRLYTTQGACTLPVSEDYRSLSHQQANVNAFHVCLPHFKYVIRPVLRWMYCSTFQLLLVQKYYQFSYIITPFLMKSLPSRNTFSVDCLGFPGVASLTTPQPLSICGLVAHVRAAGRN